MWSPTGMTPARTRRSERLRPARSSRSACSDGADAHCHAENLTWTDGLPQLRHRDACGENYAHVDLEGRRRAQRAATRWPPPPPPMCWACRGERRGDAASPTFTGAGRRFEYKGELSRRRRLRRLRPPSRRAPRPADHGRRRLATSGWSCAFQPHTYTRTKPSCLTEFVEELKLADVAHSGGNLRRPRAERPWAFPPPTWPGTSPAASTAPL